MQGDCRQKLGWSLEQYAEFHSMLPEPPVLLKIRETDWRELFWGAFCTILGILGVYWTSPWVESHVWVVGGDGWMYDMVTKRQLPFHPGPNVVTEGGYSWDRVGHWHRGFWEAGYFPDWALPWWLLCFMFIFLIWFGSFVGVIPYLRAIKANGDRPRENARRTKAYEKNMVAALRKAKSAKETTDFQLGDQIRELEGHIRTVQMHEADALRFLETFKS
jgi:hypothetical protein